MSCNHIDSNYCPYFDCYTHNVSTLFKSFVVDSLFRVFCTKIIPLFNKTRRLFSFYCPRLRISQSVNSHSWLFCPCNDASLSADCPMILNSSEASVLRCHYGAGLFWLGVIVRVRVLSIGQIDLFEMISFI